MKKTAVLSVLLCWLSFGFAQPKISNLSFPVSSDIYGLYEISFNLNHYDNPYDPEVIDVYAEFVGPDGQSKTVNGFYFEEYTFRKQQNYEVAMAGKDKGWRIRFTPDQAGMWRFVLHAIDNDGETAISSIQSQSLSFHCQDVDAANGFIRKANSMYLKRETVAGGQRQFRPFFPIGPNVAWYASQDSKYNQPKGIYEYEMYIDSLYGKANFMRVWLTRYQYLSLYGPEYTQMVNGKPTVYFERINQKDAAELDHIVDYAAKNDISLMLCIFTYGDFKHHTDYVHISDWFNNPFNTILKLPSPFHFFSDSEAKRITRNLIRYIVARWGYATNLASWELWNEVTNMYDDSIPIKEYQKDVVGWHEEMTAYLRSQDPYNHLVSTSTGNPKNMDYLLANLFNTMDFVQIHNYQNIHKALSNEQFSCILLNKAKENRKTNPTKPFFVGEFAFGLNKPYDKYSIYDPHGVDVHNSLWSSLFSGSMGSASFWFWDFVRDCHWYHIFKPMLTFSKQLPQLSDSFSGYSTASFTKRTADFPNGIQTYYMMNASEDTLYGWCQDSSYSYQALRRLTGRNGRSGHFDPDGVFDPNGYVYTLNPAKKPKPCSRSNEITLTLSKQEVGTQYIVRWYDAETGLEMPAEKTTAIVKQDRLRRNKFITIAFPSSVRDLKRKQINNTLGDAVFSLIRDDGTQKESSTQGTAPIKKVKVKVKRP